MKKIQITQELFSKMVTYFYSDEFEIDDCTLNNLYDEIKCGIGKKLNAVLKHDRYTRYKTADTAAEKEQARQEYLDMVGMHKDFRYSFQD